MDLIAQAITGALSRRDEDNVQKLYTALKADIQKRYGADVTEAIGNLEQDPESEEHIEDLEDGLIVSGARKDKALLTLAKTLLDTLNPPDDDTAGMGTSGTALAYDLMVAGVYDDDDEDDELVIG